MTSITEPCTVTSAQLIAFAGNVNDRRVIDETRELAVANGIEPDNIAAIRYEPAEGSRLPRLIFITYMLDEVGQRMQLHDDGTPWDPDTGKPSHFATREEEIKFRGQMPTWWAQAVRTPIPTRPEE